MLVDTAAGVLATLATTSPTAATAAGAAGAPAGLALTAAAVAKLTAEILERLRLFQRTRRGQVADELRSELAAQFPDRTSDEVDGLVREEMRREQEFERKMATRLSQDIPKVLAIADVEKRRERLRAVLEREQRYIGMRIEAMHDRAIAHAERLAVKEASPLGAYWWLSPLVKQHTPGCLLMGGRFWPWEVLDHFHPLVHTGCFPAGVVVGGRKPLGATTRWWEGDLVVLRFASGRELPVTPNHPVLTQEGWVAAGEINVGRHVVSSDTLDGPRGCDADDEQMPSRIEDVAGSLLLARGSFETLMPGTPVDFHGDGFESDVHVVRADRFLRDGLVAARSEKSGKVQVVLGDVRAVPPAVFESDRTLQLAVFGHAFAAHGGMGGGGVPPVLFGSPLARQELRALRDGSERHALLNEVVPNALALAPAFLRQSVQGLPRKVLNLASGETLSEGVAAQSYGRVAKPFVEDSRMDAVAVRDALDFLASDVALDEVVDVDRRWWAGYVYNLETEKGWYLAEGIVVHNCRCQLLTMREAVERGYMTAGEIPDTKDALRRAREAMKADGLIEATISEEEWGAYVEWLEEAAYREVLHPRGRTGEWRAKPRAAGALDAAQSVLKAGGVDAALAFQAADASPAHPTRAGYRAKAAELIFQAGAEVPDAVLMLPEEAALRKERLRAISKGDVARAFKEYAMTPLSDLELLSGIRVETKPVHGQANTNMQSRLLTMGSTSVTGDFRHELGHALRAALGGAAGPSAHTPLTTYVAGLHDQTVAKAKAAHGAKPTNVHNNAELQAFYEKTYGTVDRRSLDSWDEDFAEHYRAYHKAVYQSTHPEAADANPEALKHYRDTFPGWTRFWDAWYTAQLVGKT